MARAYASIPKFKKVEAALRHAATGFLDVKKQIENALSATKMPDQERKALESIHADSSALMQQTGQLLYKLYDCVEKK